jgi:hypothetical protein
MNWLPKGKYLLGETIPFELNVSQSILAAQLPHQIQFPRQ